MPLVDLLYETGIIDKILEFCEKDYNRIDRMLDRAINFSNIDRIVQVPALASEEKLTEVIDTLKNLKNEISPDVLEAIKAISLESAPEWQAFKDTIAEKVYSDINEQFLYEAENKYKQEVSKEGDNQESGNTESTDNKGFLQE